MEFALNSKIIESEKRDKINNAIILLHGYGGDGADISSIAYTWKRFINNTIFFITYKYFSYFPSFLSFNWDIL